MEDRRAHDRLDVVESDIKRIEISVIENTALTRTIEHNTSEIVQIMRGAKGVVYLVTLLAKIGIAVAALYALWQGFLAYLRG
jgi:hypothetical protein